MTYLPPTRPIGGLFQRESKKSQHVLDRYECCKISPDAEWVKNMERAGEKDHRLIVSIWGTSSIQKMTSVTWNVWTCAQTKYSQNGNVSSCCFQSRFYRFWPYWAELKIPPVEDVSPAVFFWLKCATKLQRFCLKGDFLPLVKARQ